MNRKKSGRLFLILLSAALCLKPMGQLHAGAEAFLFTSENNMEDALIEDAADLESNEVIFTDDPAGLIDEIGEEMLEAVTEGAGEDAPWIPELGETELMETELGEIELEETELEETEFEETELGETELMETELEETELEETELEETELEETEFEETELEETEFEETELEETELEETELEETEIVEIGREETENEETGMKETENIETEAAETEETEAEETEAEETEAEETETEETETEETETEETEIENTEKKDVEPENIETEAAEETEKTSASVAGPEVRTLAKGYWRVHVRNIRLRSASTRVYDGTDRVSLQWDLETEYSLPGGIRSDLSGAGMHTLTGNLPKNPVICRARLSSGDAGERMVIYRFTLADHVPAGTRLQVDNAVLKVTVTPRALSLHIPNAWKYYHTESSLDQLHLTGGIQVTGFLTDASGRADVPDGFSMPELAVNKNILDKDTDLYRDGHVRTIAGALTAARTATGALTGSTGSGNYFFDESKITGGAVTLRKAAAVRGRDYTVSGEAGAFFEDSSGNIWIRGGTGLTLQTVDGSGYNTVRWSGGSEAVLQKRSAAGELLADSDPVPVQYHVDSKAPEWNMNITGCEEHEDVLYAGDEMTVDLSPPSDGGSGTESAQFSLRANSQSGAVLDSGSFLQGKTVMIRKAGTYVITAAASDHVGNRKETVSRKICVDTVRPQISISGIADRDSERGSIRIRVICRDENLNPLAVSASLTGAYSGRTIDADIQAGSGKAEIHFPQLGADVSQDDLYTLHVTAKDLAGNRAEKQITFTLNNTGSLYSLSRASEEQLAAFWHRDPFDVTFLESNLDTVQSAEVLCIRNRETVRLQAGSGFQQTRVQGKDGRNLYQYTLPAVQFEQEGRYEIILLSKDRSGGSADTAAQLLRVGFGVDRTPPDCVIAGVKDGQRIVSEEITVVCEPRDNLSLAGLRIYVDGSPVREWTAEQIQETGGAVKLTLREKDRWQRLQVYAWDGAGNGYWSEERSFYLFSLEETALPDKPEEVLSARERYEAAQAETESITGELKTTLQIQNLLRIVRDEFRKRYMQTQQFIKSEEETETPERQSEMQMESETRERQIELQMESETETSERGLEPASEVADISVVMLSEAALCGPTHAVVPVCFGIFGLLSLTAWMRVRKSKSDGHKH